MPDNPSHNGDAPPAVTGSRALETAEQRYRAFVENSSEGIWRLEFDPPLNTTLPVDAQVELAYRHGVLIECNDAMARMYGMQRAEDLLGSSLEFMLPSSDATARAYLASVIDAGYRVSDVESVERDATGGIKYFSNSMTGIIEHGRLVRMWGTQRDITAQKRVEQALRVSEARFRSMGDSAPVMIWTSGLDKGRTWFNAQWLQFVGRTADREMGMGWVQNVHPDDVGRCLEAYTTAFDERKPFTIEYRLRRYDGTYRWVLDTGAPLNESALFAGFIGSCIDIADRKREAEASAYLAAIVESSDDAILSKDLNGIIRSCNATAQRLFGYSAEELIGRPVRILIPADRQQEEDLILGRIRRGEPIEHFETVRVTKDGRLIDISLTVSPVRDGAGAIIGVSKIARDITDRKRADAELAAQQEWFRVTLDSIGDGVVACDTQGRVTLMNAMAEQLTGWSAGTAVGRPCDEVVRLISEKTRQVAENPIAQALASGSPVGPSNHTLLVAADNTERAIDDNAAPIRTSDGTTVGVVLVFRDVTERRRSEAERQIAAADRERLLEAERIARGEAERASRVKDEFVAMVSHELRTPLNAILGWTQLMRTGRQDQALLDRGLDIISRNTRAQAQLIADLLDISRIVSGKLRLETQSVDLRTLLDDAIEAVASDAEAKGIAINRLTRRHDWTGRR